MKTKSWFISIVLSLTVGAGGGYAIHALQLTKPETNQLPLKATEESDSVGSKLLPEIIASQLKSGDFSCPKDDLLTYEACLLFQGALGTWQRVDMPEECPSIVGDDFDNSQLSPTPERNLSENDALRAAKSACFGYLYAIQVANLTPVIVSTSNRTFQMAPGHKFNEPGSDASLCVSARHGICGNHAAVGLALFKKAGIAARPLEFYYQDNGQRLSHIIVEAYIDGDWRPVDTTYGAYWPSLQIDKPFRLVGTDELLEGKKGKFKPTWNEVLLPYGFYSKISNPKYFNYLDPHADVIRGNTGTITLQIVTDKGNEVFGNLPNFIGDNKADNNFDGLEFRLKSNNDKYHLTVKILGAAFSSEDPAFICIDQSCLQYSSEKIEYAFDVQNPSKLYLKTKMDVAYIIMKSFDWKVVSN